MNSNHFPRFVTILACVVALLAGCQKKQDTVVIDEVRCTHAVGLCNMPMFIAYELQLAQRLERPVKITLKNIPDWSEHPAHLRSGDVDMSVTPFTNILLASAEGYPLKIVAGSGMNGLFLISKKTIVTAEQLKGKRVGTFRADTLEMLLYSYLKKNNLSYKDVTVVYFNDAFEILQAFDAGRIDALTHVEPFATQAEKAMNGFRLADGKQVWGMNHPDCVLTANQKFLAEKPRLVKAVITAMIKAKDHIEKDPDDSFKHVVGKYYKFEDEKVRLAAKAQPPLIDITKHGQFMEDRFQDLKDLGYVQADAKMSALDLSLLGEALKENP